MKKYIAKKTGYRDWTCKNHCMVREGVTYYVWDEDREGVNGMIHGKRVCHSDNPQDMLFVEYDDAKFNEYFELAA